MLKSSFDQIKDCLEEQKRTTEPGDTSKTTKLVVLVSTFGSDTLQGVFGINTSALDGKEAD